MNKLLVAASVVSVLSTFACAAGSTGSSSLLDACSGKFSCTDGSDTVSTELEQSGGACTAGQLTLNGDGTVGGADSTTWTGTENGFSICASDGCLVCTPDSSGDAGSPTPAPKQDADTGKCLGTAQPCNGELPTDCTQRGCSYDEQIGPPPDFEVTSYCAGTSVPCDQIYGQYSCFAQQGCSWSQ